MGKVGTVPRQVRRWRSEGLSPLLTRLTAEDRREGAGRRASARRPFVQGARGEPSHPGRGRQGDRSQVRCGMRRGSRAAAVPSDVGDYRGAAASGRSRGQAGPGLTVGAARLESSSAGVAQLVEQRNHNPCARGSIPFAGIRRCRAPNSERRTADAGMAEAQTSKADCRVTIDECRMVDFQKVLLLILETDCTRRGRRPRFCLHRRRHGS
jgi:hypothetical protein